MDAIPVQYQSNMMHWKIILFLSSLIIQVHNSDPFPSHVLQCKTDTLPAWEKMQNEVNPPFLPLALSFRCRDIPIMDNKAIPCEQGSNKGTLSALGRGKWTRGLFSYSVDRLSPRPTETVDTWPQQHKTAVTGQHRCLLAQSQQVNYWQPELHFAFNIFFLFTFWS